MKPRPQAVRRWEAPPIQRDIGSAIRIHRQYEKDRQVWGKHFWATGYCVSTVGLDEQQIRRYIQEQEKFETGQNTLDFE